MSNGSASSFTVASPSASRARIARRGSVGQGCEGDAERVVGHSVFYQSVDQPEG
jgi:hypothetical protein